MCSWPVHTIQFRAGANQRNGTWLMQDLDGWSIYSSIPHARTGECRSLPSRLGKRILIWGRGTREQVGS